MYESLHPTQQLQVIRQQQSELASVAQAARLRRQHRALRGERESLRRLLRLPRRVRSAVDALGLSRHLHWHVPRHSGP